MVQILETTSVRWDVAINGVTNFTTYASNRKINAAADRYWLDTPERIFLITLWELDALFAPTGKVALEIVNIEDPATVTGTWISYDAAVVGGMPPAPTTTYYFVLDRMFYDGAFDLTNNKRVKGMKELVAARDRDLTAICGRLGKNDSDEYCIFFNIVKLTLLGNGGGEGGATGGARVPSGGQ